MAELTPVVGLRRACVLSGRSRASHYRVAAGPRHGPPAPRCSPPNKLTATELAAVLELFHLPQFVDLAPAQVWAIVLDAGRYVASISTMYRVLRAHDEIRERRRQASHPARVRPELVARHPNEVWSWDITKLKGPSKGVYFDLLRDHRHLLPQGDRLDGRAGRDRGAGQSVHRRRPSDPKGSPPTCCRSTPIGARR